jgi:hypothetical protein
MSYTPIGGLTTVDGDKLRVIQVYNGQCGCSSINIDIKVSEEKEFNYSIDCNRDSTIFVTKSERFLEKGKLRKEIIYRTNNDNQTDEKLILSRLDSLVLYELPDIARIDFEECTNLKEKLKNVEGFHKYKEYEYEDLEYKSLFKTKFKLDL